MLNISETHKIIINEDDKDLLSTCKNFIKFLENDYNDFLLDLSKNEKNLKKYLNHSDIIFTPEDIATKSPLTIIDAPWGSGKTYFIESLAKNIIVERRFI